MSSAFVLMLELLLTSGCLKRLKSDVVTVLMQISGSHSKVWIQFLKVNFHGVNLLFLCSVCRLVFICPTQKSNRQDVY